MYSFQTHFGFTNVGSKVFHSRDIAISFWHFWSWTPCTHEYWANTWKMCSPASAIFASFVTILVRFEAILMYFNACGRSVLWKWILKLILTGNLFKIASKLKSIGSILVSITTILTSISTILVSIEQVNTP